MWEVAPVSIYQFSSGGVCERVYITASMSVGAYPVLGGKKLDKLEDVHLKSQIALVEEDVAAKLLDRGKEVLPKVMGSKLPTEGTATQAAMVEPVVWQALGKGTPLVPRPPPRPPRPLLLLLLLLLPRPRPPPLRLLLLLFWWPPRAAGAGGSSGGFAPTISAAPASWEARLSRFDSSGTSIDHALEKETKGLMFWSNVATPP